MSSQQQHTPLLEDCPYDHEEDCEAEKTQGDFTQKAALVTASVVVYWLSVSLVPVYNKRMFNPHIFPYPITTAAIQLVMVAFVLGVISILKHYLLDKPVATPSDTLSEEDAEGGGEAAHRESLHCRPEIVYPSWVWGPHLTYKLRVLAPLGILFGLKYGVTNWGLQLVPTPVHVLLQATDIVWTVLAAVIINRERLGWLELGACAGAIAGTLLLGIELGASYSTNKTRWLVFALAVNLTSPILLGLCISTLRRATVLLMLSDNGASTEGARKRRAGLHDMTCVELTCHKLYISAASAAMCSVLLEGFDVLRSRQAAVPVFQALCDNPYVMLQLAPGSVLIMIFQVNLTWLSALTSATTVGVVGGVKVVPQWIISAMFSLHIDLNPLSLAGATVVMVSAAIWTCARMREEKRSISV
mmetsp:Transcript_13065/g.24937  ORF Transcript_13065/g.24937 Transcript_13065/m.24937 type:complete len:415 (+) Transcript_13065:755-1999(+)|eukprot:CAMPEP_0114241982 /NCGR_PEP_ID=MMETSP0058-20121206/9924_1 /TAXON_ID=36894 /ORGANISM="Pyramimonas parkeae, CCMP726" /LENGTH=414 /DNA_ID=CAMNT_0001354547 /DNA_START=695 /DNA_END=1939 /DNA_ORIENTATION=+